MEAVVQAIISTFCNNLQHKTIFLFNLSIIKNLNPSFILKTEKKIFKQFPPEGNLYYFLLKKVIFGAIDVGTIVVTILSNLNVKAEVYKDNKIDISEDITNSP